MKKWSEMDTRERCEVVQEVYKKRSAAYTEGVHFNDQRAFLLMSHADSLIVEIFNRILE